jgi:hypothetical protein
MWDTNYDFNKQYTGKEVKEISLCDNDSLKNTAGDIYRLWNYNRDLHHTNFYYSLLRISLTGLRTGNIKTIIFRGGLLNLLLFTFSFFMFFILMRVLFKENIVLPFAAVFCTFFSPATISNTLLLRPYQLQETLFIAFVYFFVKFNNIPKYTVENNRMFICPFITGIMAFITALTLLTGYYALFFVGLFGLFVIYSRLRKNNIKEIYFYLIILVCGIVLAQFGYQKYLRGFMSGRAKGTIDMLLGANNLTISIFSTINIIKTYYFSVPIVIINGLLIAYLVVARNKFIYKNIPVVMFCISILYTVFIIYLAPYKTLRYVMSVFPFFIFFPMTLVSSIQNKKIHYSAIVLLLISFAANAFNINKIENVFKDKPASYLFTQNTDIPVFVVCTTSYWKYAELVPYFNDSQFYFFNPDVADVINTDITDTYSHFYLVVEDTMGDSLNRIDNESFTIVSQFQVGYFLCVEMTRKEL